MESRSAAVRSFLNVNASEGLAGTLCKHIRSGGVQRIQKGLVGSDDLPLLVQNQHHVGHGVESFSQKGGVLHHPCPSAAPFAVLAPGRGEVGAGL